jgi:acyl-CoA thioesterase FadM
MKLNLYNLGSEHVYATSLRKLVNVNRRTMKPVPNTPNFDIQAESLYDTKSKLAWTPFPDKVPSRVFSMQMCPVYSDTDFLNHVNNSSYVRFCLDCYACAAKSSFYSHFEAGFCYPVLEVDIQYLDQSYANDALQITTWQSEIDIRDLFFTISRENKVVAKAFLRFGVTKLEKSSFIYPKL